MMFSLLLASVLFAAAASACQPELTGYHDIWGAGDGKMRTSGVSYVPQMRTAPVFEQLAGICLSSGDCNASTIEGFALGIRTHLDNSPNNPADAVWFGATGSKDQPSTDCPLCAEKKSAIKSIVNTEQAWSHAAKTIVAHTIALDRTKVDIDYEFPQSIREARNYLGFLHAIKHECDANKLELAFALPPWNGLGYFMSHATTYNGSSFKTLIKGGTTAIWFEYDMSVGQVDRQACWNDTAYEAWHNVPEDVVDSRNRLRQNSSDPNTGYHWKSPVTAVTALSTLQLWLDDDLSNVAISLPLYGASGSSAFMFDTLPITADESAPLCRESIVTTTNERVITEDEVLWRIDQFKSVFGVCKFHLWSTDKATKNTIQRIAAMVFNGTIITKTTTTNTSAPTIRGIYTVQPGDFCFAIAENTCGDGSKWSSHICNAESVCASELSVGQTIQYDCSAGCAPTYAPTPATTAPPESIVSASAVPTRFHDFGTYTVQPGDFCFAIAKNKCGNGSKWSSVICNAESVCASELSVGQKIQYHCMGVTPTNWNCSPPSSSSSGLSAGAIASVVIGCVLVLVLALFIMIRGIRCRPQQPRDAKDRNRDPNRADPVKAGDLDGALNDKPTPQPRAVKDWNRDPNRADPVKAETSGDAEQVLDVRALVKEWSRGRGCR
jgi:LysM repeat protein